MLKQAAGELTSGVSTARLSQRHVSLDAFRGLTIAGMILVNNPGDWSSVYAPLRHAAWNGWTPTDLVFPFFLFIMGVSCFYSFANRMNRGESRSHIYLRIIKRTLILFALGLLINFADTLELRGLRIPGVLQRIAVVYLFTSVIVLNLGLRSQIVIAAICLFTYWAAMTLVPVPGYGQGNFTAAGNFAFYVDRLLLAGHIRGPRGDALGVLSTLPAISSGLAGVLTGHLLRSGRDKSEIASWLFVFGWVAIGMGLLWDLWFPINKILWSSSYVVFTTGAALELLGICYFLFDVKLGEHWALPAVIFGTNAITAFVLSTLVYLTIGHIHFEAFGATVSIREWVYDRFFASWASPHRASLAFAVAYVSLWWIALAIMHRRKIFIRL